jgi:alpha-beta hydrolase superfamily lysophospholipase
MNAEEFTYPSQQGGTLRGKLWQPRQPRAVVQIVHGMCEHLDRYAGFAEFLAQNGYVVCANDHLGHGGSHNGAWGSLGKDGHRGLTADMRALMERTRRQYPLPYFLLGHSMGSYLARIFCAQWGGELAGAVFSGTGVAPGGTGAARALCALLAAWAGKREGRLFARLIGGMQNRKFAADGPQGWLSRDPETRRRFAEDPRCGFLFTYSGYLDLFTMLLEVSKDAWYAAVPKGLPVLLFSGGEDPVGDFGRGVQEVCGKLRKAGLTDVSLKVYPGGRHEMLNETNRDEVYEDVLAWLDRYAERDLRC